MIIRSNLYARTSISSLSHHLNMAAQADGYVAVDIETFGEEKEHALDFRKGQIVSIGFCFEKDGKEYAFHVPLNHERYDRIPRIPAISLLSKFFANKRVRVAMHNGNFDKHFIEEMGVPVENFVMDTMVAFHLVECNERVGLKEVCKLLFNADMGKFKNVFGKKNPIEKSSPGEYEKYLYHDVHYTLKLANWLDARLAADKLEKYFYKIEMPVLHVLYKMEKRGDYIDEQKLIDIGTDLKTRIDKAINNIYTIVGDPSFNPNSPKQMADFVFNQLGAPVVKASKKTKNASCDSEALEYYAAHGRSNRLKTFASAVLEYREYSKLYSTYVEGILASLIEGKTNPKFKMLTVTGRLSSSDPNAQNIPSDPKAYGIILRECFVPPPGWALVVLDYSQIELRITAHMSQDEEMIRVYNDPKGDIHQSTADACGCDRKAAKVVNFGLIYKMYYKTLAKKLGVSEDEAEAYVQGYFKKYWGVAAWQKMEAKRAHKFSRTRTILGRSRTLPDIHNPNRWIREKAERDGINFPIQGTAAELTKLAMLDCEHSRELRALNANLVMQVHDELMFRCPIANAPRVLKIAKSLMENAFSSRGIKFSVPIIAEGGIGHNWLKAKG